MTGYLDILDMPDAGQVILASQTVLVPRARLGTFIRLGRRAQLFDEALRADYQPYRAAKLTRLAASYLELACTGCQAADLLSQATGSELLVALAMLRQLNNWNLIAAWLDPNKNKGEEPPAQPYAYAGRFWATWVHTIATRYGWSRDQIFDLWPEEAALYMQEILVSEWQEREDERALAQVSYRYDKATKSSKFQPAPKPSWMINDEKPPPQRVLLKALPIGLVVPSEEPEQ